MKENFYELQDAAQDARRALERRREELTERIEQLEGYARMLEAVDELLDEIERLKDENEQLRQEVQDEKEQREKAEMQLNEMSKLSAGMAKKASEDNLLKALRTYVNRSKRKTADKRAFAKSATLEIANANGLDLPEDLKAAIDSLDDEQTGPKVVNISGSYNDIHDNGSVDMKTVED